MGSCTGEVLVLSVKERAKDMLPILPLYIRRIRRYLEASERSLVMPVEIPTVPMAENGNDVMAVDLLEENLEDILPIVTSAKDPL